jgi:hypothetical protein
LILPGRDVPGENNQAGGDGGCQLPQRKQASDAEAHASS